VIGAFHFAFKTRRARSRQGRKWHRRQCQGDKNSTLRKRYPKEIATLLHRASFNKGLEQLARKSESIGLEGFFGEFKR
jgi:hypothetical protein